MAVQFLISRMLSRGIQDVNYFKRGAIGFRDEKYSKTQETHKTYVSLVSLCGWLLLSDGWFVRGFGSVFHLLPFHEFQIEHEDGVEHRHE